MAAQQAQIEETIRTMKLALKRKADDSDSDTFPHAHTNRGNKLKRRARFVREGKLDDTGGLAYRKRIDHAGYTRTIIETNPPLYDADGELVSMDEEDSDSERKGQPNEDSAFGGVRLDKLLRPLTAAGDLKDHPSLNAAYKSKALTQMATEALEKVRQERAILWKAKRLLRRFRGDAEWMPCERFETDQDEILLLGNGDGESSGRSLDMDAGAPEAEGFIGTASVNGNGDIALESANGNGGEVMDGIDTIDMLPLQHDNTGSEQGPERPEKDEGTDPASENTDVAKRGDPTAQSKEGEASEPPVRNPALDDISRSIESEREPEAGSEQTSNSGKDTNGTNAPSHAMTTRARARSPVASPLPSPTPSDSASIPAIHPWYLHPLEVLPDRDLGLPPQEAEETRKLLLLYVQKQEQVVRSWDTLASGLLRADRHRREIWRAAKAEGHVEDDGKGNMVTTMSDGEDFYELEDWGITVSLEKGKDEVEEGEEEGRRGVTRRRRVNRM